MRELSIFIDESGDAGFCSEYYLITLVFHEQADRIDEIIAHYEQVLSDQALDTIPFHFNPLLNGNDNYKWKGVWNRRKQLNAFAMFVQHLPFTYQTFSFGKHNGTDSQTLAQHIEKDVTAYLRSNLSYLQSFDGIKIYYDDGQSIVTRVIHASIEKVIARQATVYRDASPEQYRLCQVADYICGIELTALKFENGRETNTDREFFDGIKAFKKNYLKKVRKHLL